jgi:hypothetical protein
MRKFYYLLGTPPLFSFNKKILPTRLSRAVFVQMYQQWKKPY